MNAKKISDALNSGVSAIASCLKVALMTRGPLRFAPVRKGSAMLIMANGPSLRQMIDNDRELLERLPSMAVNFAANAPEFRELRPAMYVLADPHFFTAGGADPNVERLWTNLRNADWEPTLFVPGQRGAEARERLAGTGVKVRTFSMTPIEGPEGFRHRMYAKGLGMPRPRNVLIPALMCALGLGYEEIWVTGADHTWTRTLSVDDANRVVSIQPHFYADGKEELKRVDTEYRGVRLHQVLGSMATAFASYHAIRAFAAGRGQKIYNATPGSFIDAFERRELKEIDNNR